MRFRRLCLEILALRFFLREPISAKSKHLVHQTATYFFVKVASALVTRSTCCSGLTLRKTAEIRPFIINDEGASLHAHKLFAHEVFLHPNMIIFHEMPRRI